MSLFATNNILRGLCNIDPGRGVLGIVFNHGIDEGEEDMVWRFFKTIRHPILCDIPRSDLFRKAEIEGRMLCALFLDSEKARILRDLAVRIMSGIVPNAPSSLNDDQMEDLAQGGPIKEGMFERRARGFTFETFDSKRNLTCRGNYIVPFCAYHGAVNAAMRISDAAVVLHGSSNCGYLMEFAFRRRMAVFSEEGTGSVRGCNVYYISMNFSKAFTDLVSAIGEVVLRAAGDGFLTMFLIPTCSTEIMGTDLSIPARIFSERHGVEMVPMKATENFLGSKFGGTFGMFDVLISRVKGRGETRELVPGTVDLVGRWLYGAGRRRPQFDKCNELGNRR